MGRGRGQGQADQGRPRLKYGTVNTDLNRLQAELAGGHHDLPAAPAVEVEDDEDDDDLYSKYIDEDDEDDDSR
jgi:hypothetical protein